MVVTTLDDLRRFASARSFFPPATLKDALQRLGFVQADPIRAPARAQDLTLRHRVRDYRAGDLERQYAELGVEEDIFINYGFVTRELQALMHPRTVPANWSHVRRNRAREQAMLAFVRERGPVHPRDVLEKFSHGTVVNYWGGSSNRTTFVLEDLHYRGLLRVVRREAGIRVYAEQAHGPPPTDAAARAGADRRARRRGRALVRAAAGREPRLGDQSASIRHAALAFAAVAGQSARARTTCPRACRRRQLVLARR